MNFLNCFLKLWALEKQICDRSSNKNNVYDDDNLEILKVRNSLVQQEITLLTMNYSKSNGP